MKKSKSTAPPNVSISSIQPAYIKSKDVSRPSPSLSKSAVITQQPVSKKPSTLSSRVTKAKDKAKKVGLLNDVDVARVKGDVRTSNKQQIFGGSLYSKALLRGGDDDKTNISVESLRHLEGAHRLFFRKCSTFPPELKSFNPRNKRGIWNSSGRVVYYTGQKKGFICKACHYSDFIQEVVDYSGKTVIVAKGRQFVFGINSSVEIFLEGGKLLGTMIQSCLSSTYEIKDSSGRLVYKIQAPCFAPCAPFVFWCCKEHFELCMDDGVTEIGKITKVWGSSVAVSEFRNCPGIEMDRVDDVRVKALLLGCFFLIEFQYYKWGGNGPMYFLLMMLIFAGILAYYECAGYCHFWSDERNLPIQKV